jgi:hypothetical protein
LNHPSGTAPSVAAGSDRHCERERSNPSRPRKETMDCFVAFAPCDDGGLKMRVRLPAARIAPGLLQNPSPQKTRAQEESRVFVAPAASRANFGKHTSLSHQVRRTIRPSLRDDFTAYFVLSPVTGLFCHRRRRNDFRQLDTSVGAPGPHDFAVRQNAARQRVAKASIASRTQRS